ncbi:MAG: TM0106 family RecB-like putative nuclease, partial [bacterium]
PDAPVEIHYDIEDDPTQDFVYLHGIALIEKGKEPEYIAFFADSFEEEKKITLELFDFFRTYKDAPVYHYSPHEKTTIKRLISKHNIDAQDVFDNLFAENGKAIDLYKIINDKTDWPLTSYSLKDVCRYLGFEWDAEDAGGAASVVWVNDYLKGQKELKAKILQYNKDDCLATFHLKNKLIELQK